MARAVAWVLLGWFLVACSGEPPGPVGDLREPPDGGAAGRTPDRDGDGLCTFSEDEYGTDPDRIDTDGDGLSDLVEVANGFDPASGAEPAEDQVGLLEARRGATLELKVRVTVQGDSQELGGFFSPITAHLWRQPREVTDFFQGAVAVSADPSDNVRGIDYDSASFGLVEGSTRLGFSLTFGYPFEEGVDCARAYPFRYGVKTDDGDSLVERLYLLVVAPEDSRVDLHYCVPEDCF